MDKVWFKLRQTHYPPGPEEVILSGRSDGSHAPICLGHCISDLRHLDFPLNAGSVARFPSSMKVYRTRAVEFEWDEIRASERGMKLGAGAPIVAALGLVTVTKSIKFAFERSASNHEEYERLDTYIVQPSRLYVEDVLDTQELRDYVGGRSSWSFFMITGIRVARSGKRSLEESRKVEVEGGPEVSLTIATGELTGNFLRRKSLGTEAKEVSDFVWAIRLAKVHKGILMTDWSISPYTRRATFSLDDGEKVDVGAVVKSEGMEDFWVVDDEKLGESIVIGSDS